MPGVVTAQDAMAARANLNKKIIDPVPEKMMKQGKPIKIYNVGPWRWTRQMASLGAFTVLECPKGKKVGPPLEIPYIIRETVPHEASNWKMTNRFEDGMDVALAILGEGPFQAKEQGFRRFGVFIAAGDEPTIAEIAAAEEELKQYRMTQVAEADNFWNAGPMQYGNIVQEHRDAAVALNVDRPWLRPIADTIPCPGCGEKISPDIAFHASPYCGTIINEDKYKKLKRVDHKQQPTVQVNG